MRGHDAVTQQAWDELARPSEVVTHFDPAAVADLPAPARRLLTAALTPGVPVARTVVLEMHGRIRLGRWLPFTARQVLRVGSGMLWAARVAAGPVAVSGADRFWRGAAELDFRLYGRVPVARATGPDIDLSTVGRMAAETVAWAPQGLLPALGARWIGLDDERAVVVLEIEGRQVAVTVTVDDRGRLVDLGLDRWGKPDGGHFGWHAFGGSVAAHGRFHGIRVATAGVVGWHHGQPDAHTSEFFAWEVTDARFPHVPVTATPGPLPVVAVGAPARPRRA